MTNHAIGRQLKVLMEERGMRQVDLAAKTDLSKATISALIHGNYDPTSKTLRKLADALGVSPADICSEVDTTPVELPERGRVRVEDAAHALHISPQFLRIALQKGKFDFGFAVKLEGEQYSYFINAAELRKFLNGEKGAQV